MQPDIVVPATKEPTFFNKTMALGALVGTQLNPGLGTIIGAIAGGIGGRVGMAYEKEHGHVAHAPTMLNESAGIGIVSGLLLGGLIAGGIAGAAFLGGAALSIGVATAISATLSLGAAAIGGLIGGAYGKREMEHDYEQAKAVAARSHHVSIRNPIINNPDKSHIPQIVTQPDIATRQDFVEKELARRSISSAQKER